MDTLNQTRSWMRDGIIGALMAHVAVILIIWMSSFGATIPGLYFLWIISLPIPIVVGIIAELITKFLNSLVRKDISFMLASVTIFISYPISSILLDILVFDLKIQPEPFFLTNLMFNLAYLLVGIGIELVMAALIIILIIWDWISGVFLHR